MIGKLFNPWVAGVLYAAILSAIMSTISAQLLVASNTLTEDFYKYIVKRKKSNKELIWVGRICIIIIFVIATLLAMNPNSEVLSLVSYACWSCLFSSDFICFIQKRNILEEYFNFDDSCYSYSNFMESKRTW